MKSPEHTLALLDSTLDEVEELIRELPLDKDSEAYCVDMIYKLFLAAETAVNEQQIMVDKQVN